MQAEQLFVTADRLVIDERNARKRRDRDSIVSMKASILHHGLAQPLIVRPPIAADADLAGQVYRVFGGGRRLTSIKELIAERALPADFAIPVLIRDVDDRAAEEISLAENIIRRGMRPVDEFRAFKALADDGLTIEDIALRFGQSDRFVRGRLALAGLHPDILEALDTDELSLSAAAAYTSSADQEAQFKFFHEAPSWSRAQPQSIRSGLLKEAFSPTSSRAKFVGEDAYRAAGGVVVEDLFGDDVKWTDAALVERLAADKLSKMQADALAEGWSFFESYEEFGGDRWSIQRVHAQPVELSEKEASRIAELEEVMEANADNDELSEDEWETLEEELDGLRNRPATYTAEQKAQSGVVYDAERFEFIYGALRRTAASKSSGTAEKAEADPLALTAPVLSSLGEIATRALVAQVAEKPDLALAMLAAMLESAQSGSYYTRSQPSRLRIERKSGDYQSPDKDQAREFPAAFAAYMAMKPAGLKKQIAVLFASTVDITEEWMMGAVPAAKRPELRKQLLDTFKVDPTPLFDAEDFFSKSRKPVLDAAMKEITGVTCVATKKGEMVTEVAAAAKEHGWLPEYLRTSSYKG